MASPGIALKGSPFSAVYLRAGMPGPRLLVEDMIAHSGDDLRFIYSSSAAGYLAIFNLDSKGEPTVLYPYGGKVAAPLEKERTQPLPNSIVLDNTLGPELFVAVFSPMPFELPPLLKKLREQPLRDRIQLSCGNCDVHVLRVQRGP